MHKSILSTSLFHCLPDYAVQAGVFWFAAFMIIWKSSYAKDAENRKERREIR